MQSSKNINHNLSAVPFWIVGIAAFIVRAIFNFSQGLFIGNGGYYPLQVRSLIERGELAFPDMPLLFYTDAGILRLLSFFGQPASDAMIINVVMVIDSLSIPLLLIPLYYIVKVLKKDYSATQLTIISAFATLSFFTLHLTSSTQKNALGISFLFAVIACLFYAIKQSKRVYLLPSIFFVALLGLTHFGSFSFFLIFISLFLFIKFQWKAILPTLLIFSLALGFIYIWDPTRSERLLSAWQGLFSGPFHLSQMLGSLFFWTLGFFAYRLLKKHSLEFEDSDRNIIWTCIALLFIVPLPIISPQYTSRLSSFLFIPLLLLLVFFLPLLQKRLQRIVLILFGSLSIISIGITLFANPPGELNEASMADLKQMKSLISDPKNTVIVSRHNLEFWVAWTLHVDIAQESKFDEELKKDYAHIYIINQINQHRPRRGGRKRSHMDEPLIPSNSNLVYSSPYFKLYKYQK